jgi:VWFA-related protein
MPNDRISGPRFLSIALLAGLGLLCSSLSARDQATDQSPAQTQIPFKIQVKSNLVVVRVVVRDSKGKPVEGLKKEDFKLFDQGKEQSIAQFEVERSDVVTSGPTSVSAPGRAASLPTSRSAVLPAMPGKFLALYFDDLDIPDADMMQARNAADRYLATNLQPRDRVAIFTSGKMVTDFTADPKQIHDALYKLQSSSRLLTREHNCPDLSDYQAYQITQFSNDTNIDAWRTALDEAAHRGCGGRDESRSDGIESPAGTSTGSVAGNLEKPETDSYPILLLANRIVEQARVQSLADLTQLDEVVKYISHMPGQRTILLVSPGFLSQNVQYQLDRTIDHALRSQVVISSLDPRGLPLLMRDVDVTNEYTATGSAIRSQRASDFARERAATDVLAETAEGTGGEYFHDNNDLKAGFGAVAGSPLSYILAFAPTDAKLDGKFHTLKVVLTEKQKGASIQARRGYFSPKNEAEVGAEAKQPDVPEADAQIQEQVREALFSKTVIRQLPVVLFAQRAKNLGETRDIAFSTHLETKSLRLRKADDHNANTVIFALAIFDEKQHLVATQQKRALIHVPDTQLQAFLKTGVDAEMTFNLKPGPYTVREVVTDAEDHKMAAFSNDVKIP